MALSRIRGVRKIISESKCTHALVSDPVDAEYISGFRSTNAWLLISQRRLDLFTDFRYKSAAEEFCKAGGASAGGTPGINGTDVKWKFKIIEESDFAFLRGRIKAGSVVGFQSDTMTVDRYREMRRALPSVKFRPLSGKISGVSTPKLDSEIDSMRAAARIGDSALKLFIPSIRKGMTEIELARLLERICADLGSEKPSFDTIVLFGERGALPHGRPGDRGLAPGDLMLIDFGCVKQGFCSDMTRTVAFGKASDECRNIYDIVKRAQKTAREAARAGMKSKELDSAARDIIEESGNGKYFGHATGHGVGLRIHEKPRISKKSSEILRENTVVTIEPGIYVPNLCGVRIEDMVVLKKDGCETLTHSPRDLIQG